MDLEATGHPVLLTCVILALLGGRKEHSLLARGPLTFAELHAGNRIFSQEDNMGSQILMFDFYSTLNRLRGYCVGGGELFFFFFGFLTSFFWSVIAWKYSICKEDQVFPYALFSYFRFFNIKNLFEGTWFI